MKIGIISDTHITKDSKRFVDLLDHYFNEVDLIIHAGDYVNIEIIESTKTEQHLLQSRSYW